MLTRPMIFLFISVLLACSSTVHADLQEKAASNALKQTIYFGGDLVTMQGDQPEYVEAVMVRDGKIIYAGDKAGAVNNFAGETIEVDLKGKTLLPGFIDPHGHFMSAVPGWWWC